MSAGRLRNLAFAACVAGTIAIVALTVAFWVYGFLGPPAWRVVDPDLTIYTDATRRLLGGGGWYLPRQLNGPYAIVQGVVLYPPVTAWFFAPWLVLPPWTFSAIPVAITAWAVWQLRPAPWTWPLIALCIMWPMVPLKTLRLNPSVWLMAATATGLLYRWPGVFVTLKPSLLPFALIGIRSRGWWAVAGLLVLASAPVVADTLRYPSVVLNAQGGGLMYSLPDVPFLLIPIFAWLGSRTHGPARPLQPSRAAERGSSQTTTENRGAGGHGGAEA